MVVGIDPEKEGIMTGLKDKVIHFRVTDKLLDDLKEKGLPESLVTGLKNYRKKSWTGEEDLRKNLTKAWSEKETEQYAGMLTDLCRVNGTYLSPDDDGVLIGDRMARFLKVGVGDTIVLLGQGYHGVSAAGKYPVRGFIRMPNPEIDNQMVYMPLESCRYLYSAEGLLTSVSIALEKPKELIKTVDAVRQAVAGDEYEIMSWKEMLTELVQQIESDNYSGIIMLWILYVIIGFGVFGTVLMMTAERRKEFAVAISVGMQKRTLVFIVFIEMIMLALLGIVSGILASIPIIRYFVANPIELTGEMADMMEMFGVEPIMPMAWQLDYFVNQSVTVAVIILVAVFYPLTKIFGLNIMKALRN
ncbi:MAG: FtsX-like permease family protein [Bacteroidetes bacterium]|nr:FtsX-like permease family protein [Bacteroidota bacterium]